jgi:hypothetical protein
MPRNLNVIVQYIHESAASVHSVQGIDPANTLHLHIIRSAEAFEVVLGDSYSTDF